MWGLLAELPVAPLVHAAPDGVWERAAVIDAEPQAVIEAMSQGIRFIGVEVMWPGHVFVGAGFSGDRSSSGSPVTTLAPAG